MNPPNIVAAIDEDIQRRICAFPHHVNHASSIGAACLRQLVYQRTQWKDALLPTLAAKRIFELGNRIEHDTIRAMTDAYIVVIEQQSVLADFADLQLTCHVDGVIPIEGPKGPMAVPFDVKSMHPNIWQSIFKRGAGVYEWGDVAEGFGSKPWLRKYRGQIQLYALAKNSEYGLLVCVNKSSAEIAQVTCSLDFDYCDFLLKRAAEINGHVAAGTLPDRIPWDEDECGKCAYLHICLPDCVGKDPIAFLEESEVEELLAERELTKDARAAYERVDERIKAWAKARAEERICVGNWLVTKKETKRGVTVSIERVGLQEKAEEA